jgi:hypothetical protein
MWSGYAKVVGSNPACGFGLSQKRMERSKKFRRRIHKQINLNTLKIIISMSMIL